MNNECIYNLNTFSSMTLLSTEELDSGEVLRTVLPFRFLLFPLIVGATSKKNIRKINTLQGILMKI